MNLQVIKKKIKEFSSRLTQKSKYEHILKDYESLAVTHPEDMRIQLKIAETYFRARETEKAIETYRKIAQKYSEENFILKAVAILKNILKLDPLRVDVNIKLAELFLKLEMTADAANQYQIVMQNYSTGGEGEKLIETCQKLVEIDPSPKNRRKLADTYLSHGMTKKAIEQYEALAKIHRTARQYDDLLRVLELILPHKPSSFSMIKDVSILYLRRQDPDNAIRTMERYKVDGEAEFADLYDKAKLMQNALRGT